MVRLLIVDGSRLHREDPKVLCAMRRPLGSFGYRPKNEPTHFLATSLGNNCISDLLDWTQWPIPKVSPTSPQVTLLCDCGEHVDRGSAMVRKSHEAMGWRCAVMMSACVWRSEGDIFVTLRSGLALEDYKARGDQAWLPHTFAPRNNVSNSNDDQSIKHLVELQHDRLEQRMWRIEETLKETHTCIWKIYYSQFPIPWYHDRGDQMPRAINRPTQTQLLHSMPVNSYLG